MTGIAYTSGLLPDSNSEHRTAKEHSKKASSHVIVSAGGLEDDDADAVNPFSTKRDACSEDPRKIPDSRNLKRDLSRQNTVGFQFFHLIRC